jgi:hypothetical protein
LLAVFGAGCGGEDQANGIGGARPISAASEGSATRADSHRKHMFDERRERFSGSDRERTAAQSASTIQSVVKVP